MEAASRFARNEAFLASGKPVKIVSIATTANLRNPGVYQASLRESRRSVTLPFVFRDGARVAEAVAAYAGEVDFFLVDSEVKTGLDDLPERVLRHCGATPVYRYKPNDITVQAVTNFFLVHRLHSRSVALYGIGNLGAKLALALAEMENDCALVSRDPEKARLLAEAMNRVRRSRLPVRLYGGDEAPDILVGVSAGVPVIGADEIERVRPGGLVLDVGNGCVSPEGIERAAVRELPVRTVPVAREYAAFVETLLDRIEATRAEAESPRRTVRGHALVRVGVVGARGEVLVDDPNRVTKVYGICDGAGDLLYGPEIEMRIQQIGKALIHDERT